MPVKPQKLNLYFSLLLFPLLISMNDISPGLADGCHWLQWMCLFCSGTCSLFLPRDHDSPDATFIFILIIARFLQKQRIGIESS